MSLAGDKREEGVLNCPALNFSSIRGLREDQKVLHQVSEKKDLLQWNQEYTIKYLIHASLRQFCAVEGSQDRESIVKREESDPAHLPHDL